VDHELTRPVVCAGARLHADHTRRQLREKRNHAFAFQLALDHDAACRIHPMHLEQALGEIDTYRGDRSHGILQR
jgi:hypothetical protein